MSEQPAIHPRLPTAFTLVEILVAMAIFSIIAIILLSLTTSMLSTWQFGQARNERRTQGQAIFDRITRDLHQVTLPSSRSNTNSLQFIINPTGVSATYELPQSVFWQAPVPTDGGSNGNLAIVGYFVQWIGNTPTLSRVLINPSATSYSIYSRPTSWISDAILASNAASTKSSGYAGLLADNVLGFWVQALDPRGNPIKQGATLAGESFDSRIAYTFTNSIYATVALTNPPPVLPARVQVAIVIVDSRTAVHLTGTEKPSVTSLTGNFWGDIQTFYAGLSPLIKKGAEIQTTTIDLANSPR